MLPPRCFKDLPTSGRARLAELTRKYETELRIPWQTILSITCLIKKPGRSRTGDRPITKISCFIRGWLRSRKDVTADWCDRRAGHWDNAIRGFSALRAALCRAMRDEAARWGGQFRACMYWDLEKSYDSLDLGLLVLLSLRLDFPAPPLYVCTLFYWGARVLVVDDCDKNCTIN